MKITPSTIKAAKRFIAQHHRHNKPPHGGLFAVAIEDGGEIVGVGIAGRPVALKLDDGHTVEITRNCTAGARNGCSMIYGALCRAAKALGYDKVVTYTLASEAGTSLRAAGFVVVHRQNKATPWNTAKRPRTRIVDTLFGPEIKFSDEPKVRWERQLS